MAYVYTVEGSEDGLILATTNRKQAIEKALTYTGNRESAANVKADIVAGLRTHCQFPVFVEGLSDDGAPLQAILTIWEQ